MSRYLCWNCGLWMGDESDPLSVSTLCPACKSAMAERPPAMAPEGYEDGEGDW